ncbi:MAG: SHOCT domain-containing protein [Methanosphaera sp.]|nr:SHOCT domain-containing protein [Methanosphaera sp.]
MSLFNKIEIDGKLIPFIQKGEGVGVVKIKGFGKASARIESNNIIFDSYESSNTIKESIPSITLLSYNQGNFINEPKLIIGISNMQYVLAGVDDNDEELERFYHTLLNIKNNEKINNNKLSSGMPKPNQNITNPNKMPQQLNQNNNQNMVNNAPKNSYVINKANENPNDVEHTQKPVLKDPVDEIRRYYQLKEDGIITEEEFNKKKKQLLGI